jgi:hypothetical protein
MKSSYKVVLAILVSFIISSLVDSYFIYTQNTADISFIPHTFILSVLLFIWCKYHAQENNIQDIGYKPLLCAVLGFIGLPYYAFKCYGLKGGAILLGKGFIVFILSIISMLVIDYVFSLIYV